MPIKVGHAIACPKSAEMRLGAIQTESLRHIALSWLARREFRQRASGSAASNCAFRIRSNSYPKCALRLTPAGSPTGRGRSGNRRSRCPYGRRRGGSARRRRRWRSRDLQESLLDTRMSVLAAQIEDGLDTYEGEPGKWLAASEPRALASGFFEFCDSL